MRERPRACLLRLPHCDGGAGAGEARPHVPPGDNLFRAKQSLILPRQLSTLSGEGLAQNWVTDACGGHAREGMPRDAGDGAMRAINCPPRTTKGEPQSTFLSLTAS